MMTVDLYLQEERSSVPRTERITSLLKKNVANELHFCVIQKPKKKKEYTPGKRTRVMQLVWNVFTNI